MAEKLACPECGSTEFRISYHELSTYYCGFEWVDEYESVETVDETLHKTDGVEEPDVQCQNCWAMVFDTMKLVGVPAEEAP